MPVLFVTGAVRNTGLAIARKFASEGYDIALSSRNSADAEKTADDISREFGVKAKGYALDQSRTDSIKCVFDGIKTEFGRLDVFAANAAHLGVFGCDIAETTEEQFDDVMNANIKGTYFCCSEASKIMKVQKSGSIVIVGSVHHTQAVWGRSLYAASKGALSALVKSMAYELGSFGIRANYISAGAIHTPRWDTATDEQNAKRRANYPAGTESFPEDVANGVFYLGTDLSRTVTGTELVIDSGVSVCLLPFRGGEH